ncbi:MAG: ABC transporter permease [Alistipes sp.]|nr:ABC transporter permease [Alistipes sp.]
MAIYKIISTLRRELTTIKGDRLYFAVLVVLPLVMVLFFGVMFYRGTLDNLPIVVVDRDNSPMSRKLVSMVDATAGVEVVWSVGSMAEAESLMLEGEAMAALYVDRGFARDIYGGVTADVECYLLGTNISASGIVERDVQQAVQSLSAGVALEKIQAMGVGYSSAMVDIMPIRVQTNILSNPYLNYGYYLAPIFMIMGVVIFTILATTYAIGRELRYGTAKAWMQSAGESLWCGVVGKLLPVTTAMVILSQLIYAILFGVMGMECAGSYLWLSVAALLLIVAYQAVAIAFIAMTANLRLALSLGGGYGVMAFTFSGITFPTIAMFGVARVAAKCFPLSYFSEVFIDQAMRGAPLYVDMPKLGVLMLFIVLPILSWRRLHTVVNEEKYWGRE